MGAYTSALIQDREGFKAILESRVATLQQRKTRLDKIGALAGQVQQRKDESTKEIDDDISSLENEIRRQSEKIRVLQGTESIEAIMSGLEPVATFTSEKESVPLIQANPAMINNSSGDANLEDNGVIGNLRARLAGATK